MEMVMNKIEIPDKGYLLWREGSGKTVEIYNIVVETDRRTGIGRCLFGMLLKQVHKDYKLIYAITRAENFIAQEFYEALKFRVVAPLRHFYQDGERTVDAIMYGYDIGSLA